jgi:hypothetical protein
MGFIEDDRAKFQRGIDDSRCFAHFTGVGEIAGEPRVMAGDHPVRRPLTKSARPI